MTRKASKTTTGWRKRYFVIPAGKVWLLRGNGKKGSDGRVRYQVLVNGKWVWLTMRAARIVENDAQLAALRLQGVPIRKEPRWSTYSS